MLSLKSLWPCLVIIGAACTLDASPKLPATQSNDEAQSQDESAEWTPRGPKDAPVTSGSRAVKSAKDAAAETQDSAAESAEDSARSADPPRNTAPMAPATNAGPSAPAPSVPSAPSAPSAPAAGSGADPVPPTAAAGSGGVAGEPASPDDQGAMAGNAGSAGGESESVRQRLIDAAIDALSGSSWDGGGMEPWRTGGRDGGRLNADFVTSVLLSMRASGVCFRDVRRCVETCVVISQDCQPCAEDPECAQTLKEVCGEALGTCRMP